MFILATFIQHIVGNPSHSSQREKKRNPNWKGNVKLFLLAEDMILYIENPKDAAKKLLEFTSKFSKKNSKLVYTNLLHFFILTAKYQKT